MSRYVLAFFVIWLCAFDASARVVTMVTWNLGWHMDIETTRRWIEACNRRYVKDPTTGLWTESSAPESKPGWFVDVFSIQGWDTAQLPVCNIYRERDNDIVFVKPAGYEKRISQLSRYLATSVPADVLTFQEVNGEQAVKEILPNNGSDYDFCSVVGYKVQRIVIAWKKSLGEKVSCNIEDALSLPSNPADKQPRPGLSLTLKIDGAVVRILSVHLKSSCVSPFENGKLAGGGKHCPILQQQIDPLESWIERETADGAKVILLGDFNRNFWHELRDPTPVRTDFGSPAAARSPGALSNSLFEEIVDGIPPASALRMLEEHCDTNEVGTLLCGLSEIRPLDDAERTLLASQNYLGCRNAVGLDHILVGSGIEELGPAQHVSIKNLGRNVAGNAVDGSDQLLAISDHCPLLARLKL